MPEVAAAAVIQGVPMREGSFYGSFSMEGKPDTPVDRPSARLRVVSPGYFRLMKIPILSGRVYDEHDEVGASGKPAIRNRESHPGGAHPGRGRMRLAKEC